MFFEERNDPVHGSLDLRITFHTLVKSVRSALNGYEIVLYPAAIELPGHHNSLLVGYVVVYVTVQKEGRRIIRGDVLIGTERLEFIDLSLGIQTAYLFGPCSLLSVKAGKPSAVFSRPIFDVTAGPPDSSISSSTDRDGSLL